MLLTGFIPFADFDAHIDSGWFTLTQDGQYTAVVSVPDELIIINTSTGEAAERVRVSGEIKQSPRWMSNPSAYGSAKQAIYGWKSSHKRHMCST
jgi:hypothetical protein